MIGCKLCSIYIFLERVRCNGDVENSESRTSSKHERLPVLHIPNTHAICILCLPRGLATRGGCIQTDDDKTSPAEDTNGTDMKVFDDPFISKWESTTIRPQNEV